MPQKRREIKEQERIFIQDLVNLANAKFPIPDSVIQLDDGGVGSLQFTDNIKTKFDVVIDVRYIDIDGISVLIQLRASENQLSEVDFWKVDFSELKSYPTIDKVVIEEI